MPEPFRQATSHCLPMKNLLLLVIPLRLHRHVVSVSCKQRPNHGAWCARGDESSGRRGFMLGSRRYNGTCGDKVSLCLIVLMVARVEFWTVDVKSQELGKRTSTITFALPETAASVVIATTVVGAAATFLVQRSKAPNETEVPLKACEDCGGSGICSECKGEGFVLKKQPEETAQRARTTAKNMATRFTAGLPKKWSYCTKCSSARSCSTCGGRGKISY
ncbi:hypothetical protein FNV43_RR05407 [Rhamnella rubrinervis]|uniref:DUF7895 domain-containing protein n=1 Tax=Rhamnella rubrinervis TaxID=2594499 RepID=A0A8K0HMK2_9ROSA|nr:hypothetical protein FNV43_RR05407 [Rhamnella rubrinervis]